MMKWRLAVADGLAMACVLAGVTAGWVFVPTCSPVAGGLCVVGVTVGTGWLLTDQSALSGTGSAPVSAGRSAFRHADRPTFSVDVVRTWPGRCSAPRSAACAGQPRSSRNRPTFPTANRRPSHQTPRWPAAALTPYGTTPRLQPDQEREHGASPTQGA